MELLQLRYFQKVAKLQHMTKAAEELRIAQPALSKTISSLEKELGVLLFDRKGKYIELNSQGKAFLKKVDVALMSLEDGKRQLWDLKEEILGDIKLVVLVASNMIPSLIAEFCKEYPNINFEITQHLSERITKLDFDLCISTYPISTTNMDSVTLLSEEILLAVPNTHPLADKKYVCLKDVSNENFISFKKNTTLRNLTDAFCNNCGFTPNIILESDDTSTIRGLINSGLGIAFVPSITWQGSISPSIKLLHVSDPICYRSIKVYWSEGRNLPKSVELFKEFLIKFFKELSDNR